MDFERLNWSVIDRLRSGFLSGAAADGVYWRTPEDLEQYDQTFAERIGWKWDAVICELQRRGWTPPAGPVLDWGCGSGIASRRVVAAWPSEFTQAFFWDHSPLARQFAAGRLKAQQTGLACGDWKEGMAVGTLLLSHVLTELSATDQAALRDLVRRAEAVIWIEPGTRDMGRALATWRDQLRSDFSVVAPCTHAADCPLFQAANERHWCHFFAPPPKGIYADSNWVKFGQRAGIDLRSLPYSMLVLDKRPTASGDPQVGRLLGRPALSKADARWLHCDSSGFHEHLATRRAQPALYKAWDKRPGLPLVRVTRGPDGRVESAEEVYPHTQ